MHQKWLGSVWENMFTFLIHSVDIKVKYTGNDVGFLLKFLWYTYFYIKSITLKETMYFFDLSSIHSRIV